MNADQPAGQAMTPFSLSGQLVAPGTQRSIDIPVARLPSGTEMSLPVIVMHGARPGPSIWVSATIHGDELNGIEIIRRMRALIDPRELAGTLVALPVVNVFGFIAQSRYLPDRRDLNRSFPGSQRGSLAARLAHLFMTEIVEHCVVGIDLHTGSNGRTNLPQIRGDLDDPETLRLATAFAPPVMVHSRLRDGSLRAAATKRGHSVLLYEAGEAMRFDADAISAGVEGVMRTMEALGMVDAAPVAARVPLQSRESSWVRARRAGIVRSEVSLGDVVVRGQAVALISDPYGEGTLRQNAPFDGIVIAAVMNPIVSQGDAIVHVARVEPSPS